MKLHLNYKLKQNFSDNNYNDQMMYNILTLFQNELIKHHADNLNIVGNSLYYHNNFFSLFFRGNWELMSLIDSGFITITHIKEKNNIQISYAFSLRTIVILTLLFAGLVSLENRLSGCLVILIFGGLNILGMIIRHRNMFNQICEKLEG